MERCEGGHLPISAWDGDVYCEVCGKAIGRDVGPLEFQYPLNLSVPPQPGEDPDCPF